MEWCSHMTGSPFCCKKYESLAIDKRNFDISYIELSPVGNFCNQLGNLHQFNVSTFSVMKLQHLSTASYAINRCLVWLETFTIVNESYAINRGPGW